MGHFNLVKQYPVASKKPINGHLNIDRDGNADFYSGNAETSSDLVAQMIRARIEFAAAHGILLSGVERKGEKLLYQEWWLVYPKEKT